MSIVAILALISICNLFADIADENRIYGYDTTFIDAIYEYGEFYRTIDTIDTNAKHTGQLCDLDRLEIGVFVSCINQIYVYDLHFKNTTHTKRFYPQNATCPGAVETNFEC